MQEESKKNQQELIKPKKFFTLFTVINIIVFLSVIVSCFYFFYFKKNYNFIIEAPCDSTQEECFIRDCTNSDDCPLNGLAEFKRFSLKASDFKYCPEENCAEVCENGEIKCEQLECVEDEIMGESCLSPETETENNESGEIVME
jgi:hypothetical protein